MVCLASALALPTLLPWRWRFAYACVLVLLPAGLLLLSLYQMSSPDYDGSAGDALGLAILFGFLCMLCTSLSTGLMLQALFAWLLRRGRMASRTTLAD